MEGTPESVLTEEQKRALEIEKLRSAFLSGANWFFWIAGLSLGVQIVVFLVIYFVVAFAVDKAMSQYGGGSLKSD